MSLLHTYHGLFICTTHAGSVTSRYVKQAGLIIMSSRMRIVLVGKFRDIYFQEWVGLVNQMLQYIAEKLKLPAVSSLLEFIRADPALYPKNNKTFMSDLQQLMEDFEQANGIDHQSRDYQMSLPNCIAALLHWRTLFNLISLLDEEDQQSIWDITTTCNLLSEPLCHGVVQENADEQSASLDFTSTLKIADAHLHLDLMFQ